MNKKLLTVLVLLANVNLLFAQTKKDKTPEPISTKDKAIYIQTSLGPFGESYIPPEIVAKKDIFPLIQNGKLQIEADNYFFPSLYFTISAKPYIQISDKKKREKESKYPDYEFTRRGENLNWMRVTITVTEIPCDCKGEKGCMTVSSSKDNPDNGIKILGVLPEETKSLSKDNPLSTVGTVGDSLVNKLLPFVFAEEHPTTQNASAEYSAASGAVSILFQNLFPPKSVANSYAFIDGDTVDDQDRQVDKLGWFWKRNDSKAAPESIIGLRRSLAFLQIRRGVKGIKVKYQIEAKWDSDYSKNIDDEYVDVSESETEFIFSDSNCYQPDKPKNLFETTNWDFLPEIDKFPVLIPKEVVCQIFRKDIGEPFLNAADIVDMTGIVTELERAARPDSNDNEIKEFIASNVWETIKKRIAAEGYEKNKLNRNELPINERVRFDFRIKKIISEEINKLYRNEELFEKMSSHNDATKQELSAYRAQGKEREVFKIYRKILNELFQGKLKQFQNCTQAEKSQANRNDRCSECENWYRTIPKPFPASELEGDYVYREAVKKKLQLPTLIQLNTKPATNME